MIFSMGLYSTINVHSSSMKPLFSGCLSNQFLLIKKKKKTVPENVEISSCLLCQSRCLVLIIIIITTRNPTRWGWLQIFYLPYILSIQYHVQWSSTKFSMVFLYVSSYNVFHFILSPYRCAIVLAMLATFILVCL